MAQELQQLRPGDSFAGRYLVVRLIRAGGMGAVYEVEDRKTGGRLRALKLMHPSLLQSADSRARFEREVTIGAKLETEHIVEVVDAGFDEASGVPFMAMEMLKGEELGDRLERTPRLAPSEVCSILTQVARALDKAHGQGIVHRDLKPENLFLTMREDGTTRVKILDFGIAKLVQGANTNATQAAGTPLYMAPEQTDRQSHVSPRTDVWAFGLVAYRMLVGVSYWQGDGLQQLYRQILMDPITSAVERARAVGVSLPLSFDSWFARCVNRDPQGRWESAGIAAAELGRALNVSGTGQMFTPTPPEVQFGGSTAPIPPQTLGPAVGYAQYSATTGPQTINTGASVIPPVGPTFGSGTMVMGGDAYIQNNTGVGATFTPPPENEYRRKKSGNGPLLAIAAVVAVGMIGGGIWALTKGSGSTSEKDKSAANSKDDDEPGKGDPPKKKDDDLGGGGAEKKDPPKKKDDVDTKPEPKADPMAWAKDVEESNKFLPVDGGLLLQTHEVTRGEFAKWMQSDKGKKEGKAPLEDADAFAKGKISDDKLPVTWVSYDAALLFCEALSARVPTAEEWDRAVRGNDKRKYPWGNDWPKVGGPDSKAVAVGLGKTPLEVGTSSYDKGPFGHMDLAGNVEEWTSTDSKDFGAKAKLIRGLSNASSDATKFPGVGELFTESATEAAKEAKGGPLVGFRCAKTSGGI